MGATITIHVSGFKELGQALDEMKKTTAKGVMHRVLKKAAIPVVEAASALAPRDTGELADSIIVSTRFDNKVGLAEYSKVMKESRGHDKIGARAALIAARHAAGGNGSFAQAFVGPSKAKNKKDAIKRIVTEFGSVKESPRPYLRPAWDAKKNVVLASIKSILAAEIEKTRARAARRAAAKAQRLTK